MNDKTKKWLIVAGGLVVCLVLIMGIGSQFKTEKQEDTTTSAESTQVDEVSVEPVSETSESEREVVVTVPASTTARQTEETLPVQTDLTEQKIQPDVTKPAATQATTKTPATEAHTEEATAAAETQETTLETSAQLPASPVAETEQKAEESKAQGGESQAGKIYMPGFGWIDDIGDAQGSTAADMYENGNKIGAMD